MPSLPNSTPHRRPSKRPSTTSSTTAPRCSPTPAARARPRCKQRRHARPAHGDDAQRPAACRTSSRSTATASASSTIRHQDARLLRRGRDQRVYYPEMEALVKAESGAKRVVVFDHTLRTADDALREQHKIREVVRRAHNDYTEWSGPQRVRDMLPDEADELLKRRFAIIQVWRPIRHPVETYPLAICDARSVSFDDFVISERRYPNRVGQTYAITYNPKHQLVLVPAHAARRGAGVQGLRFGQGRPRALDRPHRLRRSDLAAERAAAREHRDPHAGVFLDATNSWFAKAAVCQGRSLRRFHRVVNPPTTSTRGVCRCGACAIVPPRRDAWPGGIQCSAGGSWVCSLERSLRPWQRRGEPQHTPRTRFPALASWGIPQPLSKPICRRRSARDCARAATKRAATSRS